MWSYCFRPKTTIAQCALGVMVSMLVACDDPGTGPAAPVGLPKPIVVLYPNGGETVCVGDTIMVTVATDSSTCYDVVLDISVDQGENWFPITVLGSVVLDQELVYPYVVPDTLTTATQSGIVRLSSHSDMCLVRVQRYDNNSGEYADQSDNTFTIVP